VDPLIRHYHFVAYNRIDDFERLGWYVVAGLPASHGNWSVLMLWPCNCPLAVPATGKPASAVKPGAAIHPHPS
jgi:hypothetical protein